MQINNGIKNDQDTHIEMDSINNKSQSEGKTGKKKLSTWTITQRQASSKEHKTWKIKSQVLKIR